MYHGLQAKPVGYFVVVLAIGRYSVFNVQGTADCHLKAHRRSLLVFYDLCDWIYGQTDRRQISLSQYSTTYSGARMSVPLTSRWRHNKFKVPSSINTKLDNKEQQC